MKRGIKLLIAVFLAATISFGIYKINNDNVNYIKSDFKSELITKGLKEATSFTLDNDDIYVANKEKVIKIDKSGNKEELFYDKELNIANIEYSEEKIYYVSLSRLCSYDIKTKEHKVILENIPNFGDYKESKLLKKENYLYVTIGAATNSAVVGDDNTWKDNLDSHDLTPKSLVLKGKNFDEGKTGAFVNFGTNTNRGQTVEKSDIGNASVIRVNLEDLTKELYCFGIRNIEGLDYDDEGKIFAIVGGMENRGLRPIVDDCDYIYELKGKETWYGWPEYSGGDPVSSPRFRGEGKPKQSFILDKHPSFSPPAPFYQHNSLSSLKGLAIDKEGKILDKNSIVINDNISKEILAIAKGGASKPLAKLDGKSEIVEIKVQGEDIMCLDKVNGYLFKLSNNMKDSGKTLYSYIILLTISIILIVILICKLISTNGKK